MSLSLEDPTTLGRQQTYYNYLSQARGKLVTEVQGQIAELSATRAEIDASAAQLANLESAAKEKVADISASREARRQVVASIAADISSKDAEIKTLRAQEKKLQELIVCRWTKRCEIYR